jgi:murein DD-endopeptidase MepM/ murein hydrolase activator NlpD
VNPTGGAVRGKDAHGSGAFGASRGGRVHKGVDYVSSAGQSVIAPIDGVVGATAPYATPSAKQAPINAGVKVSGTINGLTVEVRLFYVAPLNGIFGTSVKAGDPVGTALDITGAYPGITNHVHLRLDVNSVLTDPTSLVVP